MLQVGKRNRVSALILFSTLVLLLLLAPAFAQSDKVSSDPAPAADTPKDQAESPKKQKEEVDPLKRPLSEKERKANEKRFKQEVSGSYKKWLDEDVRWI